MKHKLTLQQQRYLRAVIENQYLLPRWSNPATVLADIYKRQMRLHISDNDAVHNLIKLLFNRGRSTNDLIIEPNDWLEKLVACWRLEGLDIPMPNEPSAEEMINNFYKGE